MNTIVGRADAACADAGAAGCREHAPRHSVTAITKIASPTLDICERITPPWPKRIPEAEPKTDQPTAPATHAIPPTHENRQGKMKAALAPPFPSCGSKPPLSQIIHGRLRKAR